MPVAMERQMAGMEQKVVAAMVLRRKGEEAEIVVSCSCRIQDTLQ